VRIEQVSEGFSAAPGHVSQMVNGTREMGEDVARRIERALGLAPGWMDADPEGATRRRRTRWRWGGCCRPIS
jgi:hypothetical protein